MTISDLQKTVDAWIKDVGIRYFDVRTNTIILSEEVGELARIIARRYGEQSYKIPVSKEEELKNLGDEMADILWVIACLANQTGVDLTDAVKSNLAKKYERDRTRHANNPKLL